MRRASIVLCLFALAGGPSRADERPSREDVAALLRSPYAEIHDFEFRFEGELRRLKDFDFSGYPEAWKESSERWWKELGKGHVHQGTIAFRQDMSAHLDLFKRPFEETRPLSREVICLFNQKVSRRGWVPDKGGATGPVRSSGGSVASLKLESSPLLVFLYPFIDDILRNPNPLDYRFLRWESIDGHRCLVFDFFLLDPDTNRDGFVQRYWIDTERGCQPIRVEKIDAGYLQAAVTDVELAQFTADDGKVIWFPTRAKQVGYMDGMRVSKEPMQEQTFAVLAGSMRINQGLPDARFSIDWGLDEAARARAKGLAQGAPRKPIRTKGQSVEEKLKAALAEADAKSEEIEATPRTSWLARHAIQLGLATAGGAAFLLAGYLRRSVA